MSNVELDDELLDPVSGSPSCSSPRRRRPALRSCSLTEGEQEDDGRREGRAEIGDSRGPYRLQNRIRSSSRGPRAWVTREGYFKGPYFLRPSPRSKGGKCVSGVDPSECAVCRRRKQARGGGVPRAGKGPQVSCRRALEAG